MKRFAFLVLALFCTLQCAAFAAVANIGNFRYIAVPAIDTAIDLHSYFRSLQIWTDAGSADVYVELNGNAATVNGATTIHIAPGGSWQSPAGCNLAISGFHIIGASGTGKVTIGGFH